MARSASTHTPEAFKAHSSPSMVFWKNEGDCRQDMQRLHRFAYRLSGSAEKADDLVQETLTRALSRPLQFTPGTNLNAWLCTILRHSYINSIRRSRHVYTPPEMMDFLMSPTQAGQYDRLFLRDLKRGLRKLTPEMREVTILAGVEGMCYEDVAKTLNLKVGTVKSRLCRARELLKKHMDGESKYI